MKLHDKLGELVVVLMSASILLVIKSFVFMKFNLWFLVEFWGTEEISMIQAAALTMVINVLKFKPESVKIKEPQVKAINYWVSAYVSWVFIMGLGFLVSQFLQAFY